MAANSEPGRSESDRSIRVAYQRRIYQNKESGLELTNFEAAACLLDSHDDYRILRRLKPRVVHNARPLLPGEVISIVVDTETTGLDHAKDEIIEIGMVAFVHDVTGSVIDVVGVFDALREPGVPIGPDITRLTGITPAMVTGRTIDAAEVEAFVAAAHLIVAHNAAFDRPFLERFSNAFSLKRWACSVRDVPWATQSSGGAKLSHLLGERGWFFDAHRAIDDCHAVLEVLASPLHSGDTALSCLLQSATQTRVRIWAEGAPYDRKDLLKKRNYRWSDGGDGRPRAWFLEVDEGRVDDEISFLRRVVYRRPASPRIERLTAVDRYRFQ